MDQKSIGNPSGFRLEKIGFEEMPGQSPLFLDFLAKESTHSRKFWPNKNKRLEEFSESVLAHYRTDRDELCDALFKLNRSYGAAEKTLRNIDVLKDQGTVAVVTGQQAGLFSGPAYTIYKALSAVRIAEELSSQGIKAVPVFWIASEDHDFEEISSATFIDADKEPFRVSVSRLDEYEGKAVDSIPLPSDVSSLINDLRSKIKPTNWTENLLAKLEDAFRPGRGIGKAFGCLLADLLRDFGIIFVNPMDLGIRKLSRPVMVEAAKRSLEIAKSIGERNKEIEAEGFHSQVLVEDGFFPMFRFSNEGKRLALKESAGMLVSKDGSFEVPKDQFVNEIEQMPEIASPNALLRPVVQDYVLPTVCYVGGAAEISYFAQNSVIYEILGRPVTPIRHRNAFTVFESRHSRTLKAYDIGFESLSNGYAALLEAVTARNIAPGMFKRFESLQESVSSGMKDLQDAFEGTDPGLAENARKRLSKMLWHVEALKRKYVRAEAVRDQDRRRRIADLCSSGYPFGSLQERTLSFVHMINIFGPAALDSVYLGIDPDGDEHKVLFL